MDTSLLSAGNVPGTLLAAWRNAPLRPRYGLVERRAGSGTYIRRGAPVPLSTRQLGLLIPGLGTTEIFEIICGELASLGEACVDREAELQNERAEAEFALRGARVKHEEVARELDSLRKRLVIEERGWRARTTSAPLREKVDNIDVLQSGKKTKNLSQKYNIRVKASPIINATI